MREHRKQGQKSFQRRQRNREQQYPEITKEMKKEHRRLAGLPGQSQAPWNF